MIIAASIDHMVFKVSDQSKSLPYYAKLLGLIGFQPIDHQTWRNEKNLTVQFKQAAPGRAAYDCQAPGINHLGFNAADYRALEQIRDAMRDAGFDAPEIESFPGDDHSLFMSDPDNIRFEITCGAAQS